MRHANAMQINSRKIDLTDCDKEPVHTPGYIQPFGALIVLDKGVVGHASDNTAQILKVAAKDILGIPLTSLLDADTVSQLQNQNIGERTVTLTSQAPDGSSLLVAGCRSDDQLIVEIEPANALHPKPPTSALQHLISLSQKTSQLQTLFSEAAACVREVTGYDRVMIYQFHHDNHGEVVAESVAAGHESYQGFHYPATDIPEPARRIFYKNWIRIIPDVDYSPVKIISAPHLSKTPVNLTYSLLRSISPIHIEYLRNMEVKASLTASLKVHGRLWGLIACHNDHPKYADPELRAFCESTAKLLSAVIPAFERSEIAASQAIRRDDIAELRQSLHAHEKPAKGLMTALLPSLFRSTGAAVRGESGWMTIGLAPPELELDKLSLVLPFEMQGQPVAAWECAGRLLPDLDKYRHVASGLLAISIPSEENNFILIFRPEHVRTITWGGDPSKLVDPADNKIHPRKSFSAWNQTVAGHSAPWTNADLDAAEELRSAVISENLKRQFKTEQAWRLKLERTSREKQELISMVSHDVRTPLQSVTLTLHVLSKVIPQDVLERVKKHLAVGQKNIDAIMGLLDQLLVHFRTDEGKLPLDKQHWDAETLLREACELVRPIALEKGLHLEHSAPSGLKVLCDRPRIMQVLSNLLGNALKFTSKGRVLTTAVISGDCIEFAVQDTGPGIPQHMIPYVFERFWQAHEEEKRGSGLGLAISKSIVDAHGGHIWVESVEGAGSTFRFKLRN